MTGFQSRVRDVINQAAPTYATAAVADRGLSHFLDPSLTGVVRFMQKAGANFPLLTPQMSATLTATAAAGTNTVTVQGVRLLDWLIPNLGVSFELLEDATISSFTLLEDGETVQIVLNENLVASHAQGTRFTIRNFPVVPVTDTLAGAGSVADPAVQFDTPFIIVPGDTFVIGGATFTIQIADEIGPSATGFIYEVKINDADGFPALTTGTDIIVVAKPAYRSEILTAPQARVRSLVTGPVAVDWVSTPMVADYFPEPESEVYIEEFDSTNRLIVAPRLIGKNDTLLKFRIQRDQLLFWRAAEGSTNWNGTFVELKAWAPGRFHLWTPTRPPLDSAPPTTTAKVVPGFAPYRVLLLNRFLPDSVTVVDALTKAVVPETDYTVNALAGHIDFVAARASTEVIITYRPRLEWQVSVTPDADDIELCVKVGNEPLQVFNLGLAGTNQIITIQYNLDEDIDSIHVTGRRADDSGGEFTVQMGDWQPRGTITSAIRYSITSSADIDYDWASSGLLFKPLWPAIELLRARLDGESIFSRYLDNGRMLV